MLPNSPSYTFSIFFLFYFHFFYDFNTFSFLTDSSKVSLLRARHLIKLSCSIRTQSFTLIIPLLPFAFFVYNKSVSTREWRAPFIGRSFLDLLFISFSFSSVHYRIPAHTELLQLCESLLPISCSWHSTLKLILYSLAAGYLFMFFPSRHRA